LLGLLLLASVFACYSVPNAPVAASFESGGLGLTKALWDRQHQARNNTGYPVPPISGIAFYDSDLSVYFWPEGWFSLDNSPAMAVRSDLDSGRGTPRRQARGFLPTDGELQRTVTNPNVPGGFIDIYHSAALATRFPPRLFTPNPWSDAAPGTFYVTYDTHFFIGIPSMFDRQPIKLSNVMTAPTVSPPD